jgi:hypothetical protein
MINGKMASSTVAKIRVVFGYYPKDPRTPGPEVHCHGSIEEYDNNSNSALELHAGVMILCHPRQLQNRDVLSKIIAMMLLPVVLWVSFTASLY